jgi:hypothetical protein
MGRQDCTSFFERISTSDMRITLQLMGRLKTLQDEVQTE